MQSLGVTGLIYGLKFANENDDKKIRATFRVGVRKRYVSDQDKQNKTTQTFMPMVAYGATAKFIKDWFTDGKPISIGDMEYFTFKSDQNNKYDDGHMFKVLQVGFVPGTGDGDNGSNGGGQRSSNQRSSNTRNTRPSQPADQVPDIDGDNLPF